VRFALLLAASHITASNGSHTVLISNLFEPDRLTHAANLMIKLPPEITFKKERLFYGWAYVFRHTQLGELGRIILQGRDDGRTHITCEVVGAPADPQTQIRAELFEPLGREISRQMWVPCTLARKYTLRGSGWASGCI